MSQERQPYSNIRRVQSRCNTLDMHEILKQEILKQAGDQDTRINMGSSAAGPSAVSTPQQIQVQQVSNPNKVGFEDYEFHFDSLDKDASSDSRNGEVKWSISTLNNNQDIKNCIQMRVGSMFFPKVTAADGKPNFFYYRRVYMQILGLPSTQAILASNGNQYHFEFEVENLNGAAVKLVPTKDTFFFQRPVSSMSDFQVRFMVPHGFRKINIPSDRVLISCVAGSNPARFTIVSGELATDVLGPVGTVAAPGIAVFISGFATADPNINSIVNSTDGLYVTNIVDNTTFEIAGINLAGFPAVGARMIIPKNHIAFPVRFTSVRDQVTNYIHVSHE